MLLNLHAASASAISRSTHCASFNQTVRTGKKNRPGCIPHFKIRTSPLLPPDLPTPKAAALRGPPLYRAHSLKAAQSTSQLGKMYVRKALSHRAFEYSKIEEQFQRELPLLFRGWVYQERLLFSRVLHFTANELFWECTVRICSRF
jgi:hypothetical protein